MRRSVPIGVRLLLTLAFVVPCIVSCRSGGQSAPHSTSASSRTVVTAPSTATSEVTTTTDLLGADPSFSGPRVAITVNDSTKFGSGPLLTAVSAGHFDPHPSSQKYVGATMTWHIVARNTGPAAIEDISLFLGRLVIIVPDPNQGGASLCSPGYSGAVHTDDRQFLAGWCGSATDPSDYANAMTSEDPGDQTRQVLAGQLRHFLLVWERAQGTEHLFFPGSGQVVDAGGPTGVRLIKP
jgi:hypothetical protein